MVGESFNSLYMRDPEAAARQRRAMQAQALMKEGSNTSALVGTGNNSMQALARVLQGGIGGFMAMRADGEAKTAAEAAKAEGAAVSAEAAQLFGLGPSPAPAITQNLGGAPNSPGPAPVPQVQQGPLGADTFALQRQQESGGNPNARNPLSSATGADQFIRGTWMDYARANPDRFQGMDEAAILARRTDPEESGRATQWYAGQNGQALTSAGLPAGPGELTLAHRFGPAGAQAALRADPNAPAAQVFGEQVMRANPDLAGKTVGQVVGQYQSRYGGGVAGRTGGTDMAGPGVPQDVMAGALADPQQAPAQQGPDRRRMIAFILKHGDNPNPAVQRQVQMAQSLLPTLGKESAAGPTVEINGPQGPGVYERGPNGSLRFLGQKPQDAPAQSETERLMAASGLRPGSPEYQQLARELLGRRGGTSVTVNNEGQVGTIPPGYQLTRTPDGAMRMEPIPGGPAARDVARDERAAGQQAQNTQAQAQIVVADVDRALDLLKNSRLPVAGLGSSTAASIPGTGAADVAALTDTLEAAASFGALQQMRAASPTGAALGAVSDTELRLLSATAGSLRQSQSPEQFKRNLERFREQYQRVIVDGMKPPPPPGSVPGPNGQGTATPPPRPVQVQSPEEAMRLPSGTPILLPDGTQGRVP